MLTPKFELSQDDEFLTLVIHAPYTNVADAEFLTEEEQVIFYSKPYYLRLHLSGRVLDDERNKATYDADKGTYTARIAKETRGEVFEELDMLTKLLTPPEPKWQSELKPNLVEEISSSDAMSQSPDLSASSCRDEDDRVEATVDGDIDWFIDQCQSLETETCVMGGAKYGFAQKKSGFSEKLMLEFSDIFDVKDPDSLSSSRRNQERHRHEKEHFSEEHYLADLFDNSEILEILSFQPWWADLSEGCTLTPEAKEKMLQLPKKTYLLDDEELNSVFLGLVDIMFAYAYNHRVLQGENNVESGWTIAKLASTLSWLDSFTSLRDVVVSCFRRALIFPLLRSWALCVKVLEDVQAVFAGGKKALLKGLLDVHTCMVVSDPRFIFNDLYITDYCVWIQSARTKHVHSMAAALKTLVPSKKDMGLDLEELELAATLVLKEQEAGGGGGGDVEEITQRMGLIGVGQSASTRDSDDDDDDSDDDDDDDDDDDEEDTSEEETDDEDDADSDDDDDGEVEDESEHDAEKESEEDRGEEKVGMKAESSSDTHTV